MTLLSASDDFVYTTLRSVPGTLGKLGYVAELRQPDGGYTHWGLARVHGEAAAQRAAADAHLGLLLQVLRMPLRELVEEARQLAAADEEDAVVWMEKLSSRAAALLPAETGGGSARHLSSVLAALSSLLRAERPASPQAA